MRLACAPQSVQRTKSWSIDSCNSICVLHSGHRYSYIGIRRFFLTGITSPVLNLPRTTLFTSNACLPNQCLVVFGHNLLCVITPPNHPMSTPQTKTPRYVTSPCPLSLKHANPNSPDLDVRALIWRSESLWCQWVTRLYLNVEREHSILFHWYIFYLIFNVMIVSAARIIVMIQKRTVISWYTPLGRFHI